MEYEVIVIGGGIGGLTVAASLAARGVNVCLFERQSQVGGCAATVEHGGYQFDPTFSLFTGWEPNGIYERLCKELSVTAPRADLLSPAYVVRLPDGEDFPRCNNPEEFEATLRTAFPECRDAAAAFYVDLTKAARSKSVAQLLEQCSLRFRTFIDIQLQTLAQCSIAECPGEFAAGVLDPRRKFWRIEGGIESLIDLLNESFSRSGGKLRLNSPVLRLAYGADGLPIGVDLLNGERVVATRAIVSNLTVWDTYGKLIGPGRTPRVISAVLKELRSWGIYQMFLTLTQPADANVPASPLLLASSLTANGSSHEEADQFVFCANSGAANAAGNVTAVVSSYTTAEDWFSYHEDQGAFEARDQAMLEALWARLHAAMPELGDGVEVIETATPQTFYDNVRRRFGMVGRPDVNRIDELMSRTPYTNLRLIGDTTAEGLGIEGVVELAWQLADQIIS